MSVYGGDMRDFKILFGSLEEKREESLKQKEERSGKNGEHWEGRALKGLLSLIIQNFLNLGNYKLYWRNVLGGLGKFFKSNVYFYNTCQIKSTLIISIILTLTRKIHLNFLKDLSISSSNFILPKHSLPFFSKLLNKA